MPVSRGARAPRRRRRRRAHAHSPRFTVVARLLRSLRRGYGTPPSAWYSGYLNPAGTTKHMCVPDRARAAAAAAAAAHPRRPLAGGPARRHYIFVASTNASATAPVTAWFNGGPGCSSLEGAFAELGQLLVDPAAPTTLVANPYAWSTLSNMLYIEAPACVGYSYGDAIADCAHNDSSQALDNLGALKVRRARHSAAHRFASHRLAAALCMRSRVPTRLSVLLHMPPPPPPRPRRPSSPASPSSSPTTSSSRERATLVRRGGFAE